MTSVDRDASAEARVWDRWLADHRIAPTTRDPHAAARTEAVLVEVGRALAGVEAPTILEVGCGDGADSSALTRFGRVTGTDLAPATIAAARERYGRPGLDFVAGDFLRLAFATAPFDAIVTLETIAHVADQPGFVRRCRELLRPGGRLVLTTQNRALYDFLGFGPPSGYLRRWLDRAELAGLLASHFRMERMYTIAPADPGDVRPALDGRSPPLPMRLAYSHRVDRVLRRLVPAHALARARARAGLARTIVAVARAR